MARSNDFQIPFIVAPIIMAVFGYFIMRQFVFDLVDIVYDDGDSLVVRNKNIEDRIPLSNIMNISHMSLSGPPRITLTLRENSKFGKEITFAPPHKFIPLGTHPIARELIERVDSYRKIS